MRSAAAAALLLLGACAAGPDYRAAVSPPSASGPFVTQLGGIATVEALPRRWWKLYDDPVLDSLVERAIEANRDLRAAAANLAAARAVARESAAGRLPAIGATGGGGLGDALPGGSAPAAQGQSWTARSAAGIGWEIDLAGRMGRLVEAARADSEAVEAVADMARVVVVAETVRAYTDACAYAQSIAVAGDSIRTARETVRLLELQHEAGSASRFDVERARAAAANAQAAMPPLATLRQNALFELAALIGETPANVPAEAARCSTAPRPAAELPVGDGAALLRRRPDLREAERRLAADTARIGVATADLYPRVSFAAGANGFGGDGSGGGSTSFSLGPLLSWSFPNAPVARARIAQAEARAGASLATFDSKVLVALKEVEQALAAYGHEVERQRALTSAASRASAAFELAGVLYRSGATSHLDLLIAQRERSDSQAALAESSQRLGSLRVDLFKALGGGWGGGEAE